MSYKIKILTLVVIKYFELKNKNFDAGCYKVL